MQGEGAHERRGCWREREQRRGDGKRQRGRWPREVGGWAGGGASCGCLLVCGVSAWAKGRGTSLATPTRLPISALVLPTGRCRPPQPVADPK